MRPTDPSSDFPDAALPLSGAFGWVGAGSLFHDRHEAGRALAARLHGMHGPNTVVVGLARGGMLVAAEVAQELEALLDVMVVRKIGVPTNPDVALGAVAADGTRYVDEDLCRELRIPPGYIEAMARVLASEARKRDTLYRGPHAHPPLGGRTVILVDDGMSTGVRMLAAARSARARRPRHLVVAVPVGTPQACAALRHEVDDVVCLHEPRDVKTVGECYVDFAAVADESVRHALDAYAMVAPSR